MNKTSSQVALVAGSSGIVGRQLVNTLLHRGWEVIGLSHRALSQPGAIPMIHVDLRDARHSTQALQPLSTVTHIFLQCLDECRKLERDGGAERYHAA
ncbi:NAD-dependent epimerase/dehydratase family protein [Klebsiella variicola]|uniref:NAD-dependent epimerase/dehydratase family protein n=1 Tax=Klebsiella variicola TaxID=244366 RepID=A0A7H4MI05_KLEVA|nr:NAD-dependent epimerase/dehydratase family protein [Klebsiella variicola]